MILPAVQDALDGLVADGDAIRRQLRLDRPQAFARGEGTQLRAVNLQDSAISDTAPGSTDALGPIALSLGLTDVAAMPADQTGLLALRMAAFTDLGPAPDESADGLQVAFFTLHDGRRRHTGAVLHASGLIEGESLAGVVAGTSSPLQTGEGTALTTENGLPLLP